MSAALLLGGLMLGALASADGAVAPAVGAESRSAEPPQPPQPPNNDPALTELAEQAARQFDQALFSQAAQTLRRAISLSPRPRLFYNLGQAYRAAGDCPAALDAYRQFLDRSSASDTTREAAQNRRDEMQACVDRAATPVPRAKTAPETRLPLLPPITTAVQTPPAEADRGSRRARLVGWGLIGAGVIAEVVAVVWQMKARGIESDLDNAGAPDPGEFSRRWDEGRWDARWAILSAVTGGVLGAAGGATLIINRDPAGPASYSALARWTLAF